MEDAIELITSGPKEPVDARLRGLVNRAERVRAIVSFWSLPHAAFGDNFIKAISGKGYLCADIHSPTNVTKLIRMRKLGANVALHLYHVGGNTEARGTLKVPAHLMHSKTFVFDLPGRQSAAIWIGSHNGTSRALRGINIETALLVHTRRSSPLYCQTVRHLDEVRARCRLVEPDLAAYYQWLQGEFGDIKVIEFNDRTEGMREGDVFGLFLAPGRDREQLKMVGAQVLLSFTDDKGTERFHWARVSQVGEMRRLPRLGFELVRHAWRADRRIPDLVHGAVTREVMNRADYFAVFTVGKPLPASATVLEAAGKRWRPGEEFLTEVEDEDDVMEDGLATDTRQHYAGSGQRSVRVRIEEASPPQEFRKLARNAWRRRADVDRDLVTKVSIIDPQAKGR